MILKLCRSAFLLSRHTCISYTASRSIHRWVAPTLREIEKRKGKMGPQPPMRRSAFLDWNYDAELYAFGKRLNEEFEDDLLRQAFIHRSYIIQEEQRQKELGVEDLKLSLEDNRSLADEGGELMGKYIKSYLCTVLPLLPEEGICAIRDYLMSEEVLSYVSSHLGTTDLIFSADFPVEKPTLVTTLKAVIGALRRGSGEERAEEFVHDFVLTQLNEKDLYEIWDVQDPLATLTKVLRQMGRPEAEPRLLREAGPNTILSVYYVGLYCDRKLIGSAPGESVDIAKQMAAHDALRRLFSLRDNMLPLPFSSKLTPNKTFNPSVSEWTGGAPKSVVNME